MALPFHLCQPDPSNPGPDASCGACCGLYNFTAPNRTRAALSKALARRTDAVAKLPEEAEAWKKAARSLRRWEEEPLFPPVRLCPLLGFLDPQRTKVGCLAHPMRHGGLDLRDCGAYDAKTCQSFECPSFLWLDGPMARLVRAACPDWYLYGLVITDVELVRGLLKLLALAQGEAVDADALRQHASALLQVRAFFERKEQAPERSPDGAVFGRFACDDLGEPVPRILDYAALARAAAPEDDVVLCLGYAPADGPALDRARSLVHAQVAQILAALHDAPLHRLQVV